VVTAQAAQHAYRLKRMLADGAAENGEIVIPERVRVALAPLADQIDALDQAIAAIDDKLIETVKADEKARRLMTIPGVGPVIATAVVATVGEVASFARGRGLPPFSASRHASIRAAARSASGASRKWATDICASFLWWARPRCCITRWATMTRCAVGLGKC